MGRSSRVLKPAPHFMSSVAESLTKPSNGCLKPSNDLINHEGDWLCSAAGFSGFVVGDQGQRHADFGPDGGAWSDLTSKGGSDKPAVLDGRGKTTVC